MKHERMRVSVYELLLALALTIANFSVAAGRRTLAGAVSKTIYERCQLYENRYIVRMLTRLYLVPNTPRNYEVQCIYYAIQRGRVAE